MRICDAEQVNHAMEDWVTLARVVRPQGRRGEVLCELDTDFPERFRERRQLYLRAGEDVPPSLHTLEEFWLPTGRSAGRIVLKFAGIDSISDAERLAGSAVLLPASQRMALEDGTFYVDDLRGCTVMNVAGGDGPDDLGIITDVHFLTDPTGAKLEDAAPILVVTRPNGDEVLIPLAKEFLQAPDLPNRRIAMRLPHGLVEANG